MDGDPEMHSGEIGDRFLTKKRIYVYEEIEYHILFVCVCLCFKRLGLKGLFLFMVENMLS